MILIGQFDSPFVRRVAVALNHYGLPFERKVLSVFKDFDAMLEINPLGKVPTLELDDGTRLFDSRMILDYLDRQASGDKLLTPDDAEGRSRIDVLNADAVALGLAEKCYERGIEFVRRDPEKVDQQWAERLKSQVLSALSWLEALQPDPYFFGDHLTRADITCAVAFTFLSEKRQVELEPGQFPKIEAHCKYCESLPEFKASPYSANEAASSGWKLPEQQAG